MTAATNTNLVGVSLESLNAQQVVYVGIDNRLYALNWRNGNWDQYDVIQGVHNNTGVTPPLPKPGIGQPRGGSPLAGFAFEPLKAAYVAYIDVNNKIQELQFGVDVRLAASFNNVMPRDDSPLAAYAMQRAKTTHIIYIDSEHHVHELYWNNSWQTPNDLTQRTGTMVPMSGSPLAAYSFENQGTAHIFYVAQDNSIRELYFSGNQWSSNNLSVIPGAVSPRTNCVMACYACEYENTQHVVYTGNDGDIHELYWSNGWKNNPQTLTSIAGAPKPAQNSALAGYACEYEKTQHVIYIDDHANIQEIYWSNGWQNNILSEAAGSGAPSPQNGTPLTGYAFENEKTEHVWYIDSNDQVHELYHSGNQWHAGEKST
jgi:Fungal fucose-specific lectin